MSSFATYVYCARLDVDNDKSVTHGWVIKCGKNVGLNAFPYFFMVLISIGDPPRVQFCVGKLPNDP
jgi:hypothetical protein